MTVGWNYAKPRDKGWKTFFAKNSRLYEKGNFVVLVHGKNFIFDELFLFEGPPEARAFYEEGYRQWESFADDSDESCGFQEVSLYKDGRQIATKDSAPTHLSETCHE